MTLLRVLASRTPVVSGGARRAASSAAMVNYKKFGDLSVHPSLVAFVEKDVLPGMRATAPVSRQPHPPTNVCPPATRQALTSALRGSGRDWTPSCVASRRRTRRSSRGATRCRCALGTCTMHATRGTCRVEPATLATIATLLPRLSNAHHSRRTPVVRVRVRVRVTVRITDRPRSRLTSSPARPDLAARSPAERD